MRKYQSTGSCQVLRVTGGIGENVGKHRWFIISTVVRAEKVLKIH